MILCLKCVPFFHPKKKNYQKRQNMCKTNIYRRSRCLPKTNGWNLKNGWLRHLLFQLLHFQVYMLVFVGCIWMFPKIVVPSKSSILIGISIINHPFWGYHYFWKHPYKSKSSIPYHHIYFTWLIAAILGLTRSQHPWLGFPGVSVMWPSMYNEEVKGISAFLKHVFQ